jgi:hypothetical protein
MSAAAAMRLTQLHGEPESALSAPARPLRASVPLHGIELGGLPAQATGPAYSSLSRSNSFPSGSASTTQPPGEM